VLRSRLHRIREQIIDEPPGTGDEEDRRASYVSRELEIALLQLDAKTLRTVDTALRRLESGEYGRCDDCLKSIPPARLQALPFADLCVLCQEARESRAGEGGVGSRSGGRRSDRH
jgi:DnaK suppressor protein